MIAEECKMDNDKFDILENVEEKSGKDSKEEKVEKIEPSPSYDVTQDFPVDPFSDVTHTETNPETRIEWNDPAFPEDPFKSNPDRLGSSDPFQDSFSCDPFFRAEGRSEDPFSESFSRDPFSESFPSDPFLESSQKEPYDPFLDESNKNSQKASDPFLEESSDNPHPFMDDTEWNLKLTKDPKELQILLDNYSFILGKLEKEREAEIVIKEIEIEENVKFSDGDGCEDNEAENNVNKEEKAQVSITPL